METEIVAINLSQKIEGLTCLECGKKINEDAELFIFFSAETAETGAPYIKGPYHSWECARIARDRGPIIK